MEPVKGGTLAKIPKEAEKLFKEYHKDLSIPSWAIRYAASKEGIMMVLSGMSNMEQLEDNIGYMEEFRPLNKEEYEIVDKVVNIINDSIAIPCTGCSYCTDGCPKNIAIPKYFSLYNAEMQERKDKAFTAQGTYYKNYIREYGKASDCIKCRKCEKACPQHIKITEELERVAKTFEK